MPTEQTADTPKTLDAIAASMITPADDKKPALHKPAEPLFSAESAAESGGAAGVQDPLSVASENAESSADETAATLRGTPLHKGDATAELSASEPAELSSETEEEISSEALAKDGDDTDTEELDATASDDTPDGERVAESQEFSVEAEFEIGDDETLDATTPTRLGDASDDSLVPVTVDGEQVDVTLGELKQRYAGEGAIDRRVQEATELRNVSLQNYENGKQILETVMRELGSALFRRTVPEPTDALRQNNPTEYLMQKDLFDQETNALNMQAQKLHAITTQADEQFTASNEVARNHASTELLKLLPVLKDAKKGTRVKQHIVDTAQHFGYTDAQIKECTDPQLFHMAYWAARGLAAARKGKFATTPKVKPRSMPKKGTANRSRATQSQRQQTAALKRARDTGKVDDVAASMIMKKPRAH